MQRQVLPERDLEEGRRKGRSEPGVPGFSLGFIRAEEMTNDLSEQLSQTFVPTLTLMKLSGQFFGETSFSDLRNLNPGKSVYLSRFYSLLVVLSLWLYVILGLASLFSEGFTSVDVFLYLFNCAVCLQRHHLFGDAASSAKQKQVSIFPIYYFILYDNN